MPKLGLIIILLLTLGPFPWAADALAVQEQEVAPTIAARIEHLRESGALVIQDGAVASAIVLPNLYERRRFQPLWTNQETIAQLFNAIRSARTDGLDPEDYHLTRLVALQGLVQNRYSSTADDKADFDILLTDALVRLCYHLLFGKVDPEARDADWNLVRELKDNDPAAVLQGYIDGGALEARIYGLRPQQPFYERLRQGLQTYEAVQTAGGWRPVGPGRPLRLGMKSTRVADLRLRLTATGDFTGASADPQRFDQKLHAAVKRFQARHQLAADGIVGEETLDVLNMPVAHWIACLRINLERLRWVLHQLPDRFVVVDIAGREVLYVEQGQTVWRSRAQVAQPFRGTPVFKEEIKYLVFNPSWNVPPGALAREILPELRRDPSYLRVMNLRVIDDQGRLVNPATIDWEQATPRNFPYKLRQDPGPQNVLGRIKFMFPNIHHVYLHDTPHTEKFGQGGRAVRFGGIRVERPYELAELLLGDRLVWSRNRIKQVVDAGQTRTEFLPHSLPILFVYLTATVDESGTVFFRPDVYERDPPVLRGLNEPFQLRRREVLPAS